MLFSKISAVRRKQSLVTLGQGLAAAAGAAALLLALGICLDWAMELSRTARLALLAIDALLLGYIVLWHLVGPIVFGPDDESIALMVERAMPDFRTRLIASVQLSNPQAIPPGASHSLVRAMIAQTEHMAAPRSFTQIIKPDAMLKTLSVAAFIVLLGAGAFVWGAPASKVMLLRALLLSDQEVPTRTQVVCLSKDQVVAIGDGVAIEAVAVGEIPEVGRIDLKYARSKATVEIKPAAEDKTGRRFVKTIDNVRESFDYVVRLNDGRSRAYHVQAEPRPALVSVEFEQEFPRYTNQPNQKRQPGSLPLLPGSILHVKARTNKPVKEAVARVAGSPEKTEAMEIDDQDRTLLAYAMKVNGGTSGVSFEFVDDYDLASRGGTIFPIDIVADQPPLVRITWPPRREELATQQARMLIAFEATDDFGLAKANLRYKFESEDDSAARTAVLLDSADAAALRDAGVQIQDAIATQKQVVNSLRGLKDNAGNSASIRDEQARLGEKMAGLRNRIPGFGGEAATHVKNAADGMAMAAGFIHSRRRDAAIENAAAALGSLEQAVSEVDLRRVKRRHEFNLAGLRPLAPEGSVIEYWVQVLDANDQTVPGQANSEHYRVKVVSEEEKRADLMNRLNDQLGMVQTVTDDQDQVSRNLGALIQEKR